MENQSKISKMFGALVLGGGMLVTAPNSSADPVVDPDKTTEKNNPEETRERLNKPIQDQSIEKNRPADNCQLEFTLYKYHRDGVDPIKTCLDDKDDEEILKIIKEAKTKTCSTPFCGCWLG